MCYWLDLNSHSEISRGNLQHHIHKSTAFNDSPIIRVPTRAGECSSFTDALHVIRWHVKIRLEVQHYYWFTLIYLRCLVNCPSASLTFEARASLAWGCLLRVASPAAHCRVQHPCFLLCCCALHRPPTLRHSMSRSVCYPLRLSLLMRLNTLCEVIDIGLPRP